MKRLCVVIFLSVFLAGWGSNGEMDSWMWKGVADFYWDFVGAYNKAFKESIKHNREEALDAAFSNPSAMDFIKTLKDREASKELSKRLAPGNLMVDMRCTRYNEDLMVGGGWILESWLDPEGLIRLETRIPVSKIDNPIIYESETGRKMMYVESPFFVSTIAGIYIFVEGVWARFIIRDDPVFGK